MPAERAALSEEAALDLLRQGEIEIEGRLSEASNVTLRGIIRHDGVTRHCVYKPVRGERPLWDFPDGTLAGREVSAYLVASASGWACVPPTVLRDGPLGEGACQLWIDEPEDGDDLLGFVPVEDIPQGWRPIMRAADDDGTPYVLAHADDERLARLAVFDAVVNNGDRKGGHVLSTVDGQVYGVDHGVCFNVDPKLRTILWGWANKRLPAWALETLERLRDDLAGPLGDALSEHLTITEVAQTGRRIERLLSVRRFPRPSDEWPAVPWPPV
jgi:uncharacterized repeat protein (TIGR03843 family)